ncbi:hypothetical protein Hanom_Chr05g00425661 [Helianthus anomalus]
MEVVVLHPSHPRPPPLQLWFKSTITVATIKAGIFGDVSFKQKPNFKITIKTVSNSY